MASGLTARLPRSRPIPVAAVALRDLFPDQAIVDRTGVATMLRADDLGFGHMTGDLQNQLAPDSFCELIPAQYRDRKGPGAPDAAVAELRIEVFQLPQRAQPVARH